MNESVLRLVTPEEMGVDPTYLKRAHSVLSQAVQERKIPGAVAGIAYRGGIVGYWALGHRQWLPEEKPMSLSTRFDLASLTKVVGTTTVIWRLIEEGQLHLDESVLRYVPELGESKSAIKIRHLLTHTSGLIADFQKEDRTNMKAALQALARLPLRTKPGEAVLYSDPGFILLGEIVARITQKPLADYVQEVLLGPWGMRFAGYNPPADAEFAATELVNNQRPYVGVVHDEKARAFGGVAGHAGLFGTALDLLIFGQGLLNGGQYDGKRVLSERSVRKMTEQAVVSMHDVRTLGWQMVHPSSSAGDLFTDSAYGHTGFTGTSLWIDPLLQVVVVLLTNRVHPSRENTFIRDLRPRFHNAVLSSLKG